MYDTLSSVVVLGFWEQTTRRQSCLCPKMPVMPPDLSIYMPVTVCIHYKLLQRMACYCCMPLSTQTWFPVKQWDLFRKPYFPSVTAVTHTGYALFIWCAWNCPYHIIAFLNHWTFFGWELFSLIYYMCPPSVPLIALLTLCMCF